MKQESTGAAYGSQEESPAFRRGENVNKVFGPPVPPLVAARVFLSAELAGRGLDLPVGVTPPPGEPRPHVLLSKPGTANRFFLGDFLIRARVFDFDAVQIERNGDLVYRLLLSATQTKVDTEFGSVWVTAATSQMGPTDYQDPKVPMFGSQSAVFWTVGLKPERRTAI